MPAGGWEGVPGGGSVKGKGGTTARHAGDDTFIVLTGTKPDGEREPEPDPDAPDDGGGDDGGGGDEGGGGGGGGKDDEKKPDEDKEKEDKEKDEKEKPPTEKDVEELDKKVKKIKPKGKVKTALKKYKKAKDAERKAKEKAKDAKGKSAKKRAAGRVESAEEKSEEAEKELKEALKEEVSSSSLRIVVLIEPCDTRTEIKAKIKKALAAAGNGWGYDEDQGDYETDGGVVLEGVTSTDIELGPQMEGSVSEDVDLPDVPADDTDKQIGPGGGDDRIWRGPGGGRIRSPGGVDRRISRFFEWASVGRSAFERRLGVSVEDRDRLPAGDVFLTVFLVSFAADRWEFHRVAVRVHHAPGTSARHALIRMGSQLDSHGLIVELAGGILRILGATGDRIPVGLRLNIRNRSSGESAHWGLTGGDGWRAPPAEQVVDTFETLLDVPASEFTQADSVTPVDVVARHLDVDDGVPQNDMAVVLAERAHEGQFLEPMGHVPAIDRAATTDAIDTHDFAMADSVLGADPAGVDLHNVDLSGAVKRKDLSAAVDASEPGEVVRKGAPLEEQKRKATQGKQKGSFSGTSKFP